MTRGIRCNCLCPGTVHTPSLDERIAANAAAAGSADAAMAAFVGRQPMGRLGTAKEIADLAVYLAGNSAQFVTGQTLVIDGGLTLWHRGDARRPPPAAGRPATRPVGWSVVARRTGHRCAFPPGDPLPWSQRHRYPVPGIPLAFLRTCTKRRDPWRVRRH